MALSAPRSLTSCTLRAFPSQADVAGDRRASILLTANPAFEVQLLMAVKAVAVLVGLDVAR